ncbi:hypothetical protein AB0I61_02710 [Polymorphospora rubra]|uniref:hypothetical protein n=1 Tax=Polymorphospora rubra TaxID=338584 RepID=UPI0034094346
MGHPPPVAPPQVAQPAHTGHLAQRGSTPPPVHAPQPPVQRSPLTVLPLSITLPAGTAFSLAATPARTDFLVANGHLVAVRAVDRLTALLREQPSLTAVHPWAALPADLRPGDLTPSPDASYDFVRIGRILAAGCEADSMPMYRTADGRLSPAEPDHTGQIGPDDIGRHVELVRRLFAVLRRRSLVLDTERIGRTISPLTAAATSAGRLDATVLRTGTEAFERFRAASWWWQIVDEMTTVTDWR